MPSSIQPRSQTLISEDHHENLTEIVEEIAAAVESVQDFKSLASSQLPYAAEEDADIGYLEQQVNSILGVQNHDDRGETKDAYNSVKGLSGPSMFVADTILIDLNSERS